VPPSIFEPLFTTKNFGVGVGLPTVRQIVELHGGTIDVESAVGQGTTVTIFLPRLADAAPAHTHASGREAAA
jgi:signal transduction histidine kinase